jgi:DNA topoisomerase VI subunit A
MPDIDTRGPSGCYGAVLFIEKEGFNALFEAVRLAERYDIAIMSTKGTSVVAARRLADKLCFEHKIPLFVLHDYDISGVNIHKTLVEDGRRYTYENKIESVDFGLRLEDVGDLEREMVLVEGKKLTQLDHMLEDGEIDDDDYEFLKDSRVELNAFTSDELVAFIERKLAEQGVKKVIPDDDTLAEAYRRRRQSEWLEARIQALIEESRAAVKDLEVPTDLREQVVAALDEEPDQPWYAVIE